MALILALKVGDVIPNRFISSFVLIQMSLFVVLGKWICPYSSIVIMFLFVSSFRFEAIFQGYRAIKHQMTGSTILIIHTEVAQTHKLIGGRSYGIR